MGGLGSTLALQGPDTIVGLLRCGLTYVLSGDRIVGMCNTMRAAFFTNSKLLPRRLSKRRSEVARIVRNKVPGELSLRASRASEAAIGLLREHHRQLIGPASWIFSLWPQEQLGGAVTGRAVEGDGSELCCV